MATDNDTLFQNILNQVDQVENSVDKLQDQIDGAEGEVDITVNTEEIEAAIEQLNRLQKAMRITGASTDELKQVAEAFDRLKNNIKTVSENAQLSGRSASQAISGMTRAFERELQPALESYTREALRADNASDDLSGGLERAQVSAKGAEESAEKLIKQLLGLAERLKETDEEADEAEKGLRKLETGAKQAGRAIKGAFSGATRTALGLVDAVTKGDLAGIFSKLPGVLGAVGQVGGQVLTDIQSDVTQTSKTVYQFMGAWGDIGAALDSTAQQLIGTNVQIADVARNLGMAGSELNQLMQSTDLSKAFELGDLLRQHGEMEGVLGKEVTAFEHLANVAYTTGQNLSDVTAFAADLGLTMGRSLDESIGHLENMAKTAAATGTNIKVLQPAVANLAHEYKYLGLDIDASTRFVGNMTKSLGHLGLGQQAAVELATQMAGGFQKMAFGGKAFLGQQMGLGQGAISGGLQVEEMARRGDYTKLAEGLQKATAKAFGGQVVTEADMRAARGTKREEEVATKYYAQRQFQAQLLGMDPQVFGRMQKAIQELRDMEAAGKTEEEIKKQKEVIDALQHPAETTAKMMSDTLTIQQHMLKEMTRIRAALAGPIEQQLNKAQLALVGQDNTTIGKEMGNIAGLTINTVMGEHVIPQLDKVFGTTKDLAEAAAKHPLVATALLGAASLLWKGAKALGAFAAGRTLRTVAAGVGGAVGGGAVGGGILSKIWGGVKGMGGTLRAAMPKSGGSKAALAIGGVLAAGALSVAAYKAIFSGGEKAISGLEPEFDTSFVRAGDKFFDQLTNSGQRAADRTEQDMNKALSRTGAPLTKAIETAGTKGAEKVYTDLKERQRNFVETLQTQYSQIKTAGVPGSLAPKEEGGGAGIATAGIAPAGATAGALLGGTFALVKAISGFKEMGKTTAAATNTLAKTLKLVPKAPGLERGAGVLMSTAARKTATEIAQAGAEAGAKKTVGPLGKIFVRAIGKVAPNLATKVSAGIAKSALKKLPVLGAAIGGYMAFQAAREGDLVGAIGNLTSGVASIVPGIGTVISAGIDAALIGRDVANATSSQPSGPPGPLVSPEDAEMTKRVRQEANLVSFEAFVPALGFIADVVRATKLYGVSALELKKDFELSVTPAEKLGASQRALRATMKDMGVGAEEIAKSMSLLTEAEGKAETAGITMATAIGTITANLDARTAGEKELVAEMVKAGEKYEDIKGALVDVQKSKNPQAAEKKLGALREASPEAYGALGPAAKAMRAGDTEKAQRILDTTRAGAIKDLNDVFQLLGDHIDAGANKLSQSSTDYARLLTEFDFTPGEIVAKFAQLQKEGKTVKKVLDDLAKEMGAKEYEKALEKQPQNWKNALAHITIGVNKLGDEFLAKSIIPKAVIGAFKSGFEHIQVGVEKAAATLQAGLQVIGDALGGGAGTSLAGTVQAIVDPFNALTLALEGAGQAADIVTQTMGISSNQNPVADALGGQPGEKGAVAESLDKTTKSMEAEAQNIASTNIGHSPGPLSKAVTDPLESTLKSMVEGAAAVARAYSGEMRNAIVGGIAQQMGLIPNEARDVAINAFESLRGMFTDVFGKLGKGLRGTAEDIGAISGDINFDELSSVVVDGFGKGYAKIVSGVGKLTKDNMGGSIIPDLVIAGFATGYALMAAGAGKETGSGITALAESVWEWFKKLPDMIWEGIKDAGSWVADVAGSVWGWFSDLGSSIVDGIADAGAWIWDVAKSVWGWFSDLGSSIVDGIADAGAWIWDVAKSVWGWFGEMGGAIIEGLTDAGAWVVEVVGQALGWFGELGSSILDGLADAGAWVLEVAGQAIDWFSELGSSILDGLADAGAWVGSAIDTTLGWFGRMGDKIVDGVSDALSAIGDIGRKAFDIVSNAVSGVVDSIIGGIQAGFEEIAGGIGSLVSKFFGNSIIPNLFDAGIGTGMQEMAESTGKATKVFEDATANAAKNIEAAAESAGSDIDAAQTATGGAPATGGAATATNVYTEAANKGGAGIGDTKTAEVVKANEELAAKMKQLGADYNTAIKNARERGATEQELASITAEYEEAQSKAKNDAKARIGEVSVADQAQEAISKQFGKISKTLDSAIDAVFPPSIADKIKSAKDVIGSGIMSVGDALHSGFGNLFGGLNKSLGGLFSGLGGKLGNTLGGLGDALGGAIQGFKEGGVGGLVKNVSKSIGGALGGTALGAALTPVLGPVGPVVGKMLGPVIGEGIGAAVEGAKKLIKDPIGSAKKVFEGALGSLGSLFGKDKSKERVKGVRNAFNELAKETLGITDDAWKEMSKTERRGQSATMMMEQLQAGTMDEEGYKRLQKGLKGKGGRKKFREWVEAAGIGQDAANALIDSIKGSDLADIGTKLPDAVQQIIGTGVGAEALSGAASEAAAGIKQGTDKLMDAFEAPDTSAITGGGVIFTEALQASADSIVKAATTTGEQIVSDVPRASKETWAASSPGPLSKILKKLAESTGTQIVTDVGSTIGLAFGSLSKSIPAAGQEVKKGAEAATEAIGAPLRDLGKASADSGKAFRKQAMGGDVDIAGKQSIISKALIKGKLFGRKQLKDEFVGDEDTPKAAVKATKAAQPIGGIFKSLGGSFKDIIVRSLEAIGVTKSTTKDEVSSTEIAKEVSKQTSSALSSEFAAVSEQTTATDITSAVEKMSNVLKDSSTETKRSLTTATEAMGFTSETAKSEVTAQSTIEKKLSTLEAIGLQEREIPEAIQSPSLGSVKQLIGGIDTGAQAPALAGARLPTESLQESIQQVISQTSPQNMRNKLPDVGAGALNEGDLPTVDRGEIYGMDTAAGNALATTQQRGTEDEGEKGAAREVDTTLNLHLKGDVIDRTIQIHLRDGKILPGSGGGTDVNLYS